MSYAHGQTLSISANGQTGTSGTNWITSGSNPVIITATNTTDINTSVIAGYLNSGTSVEIWNTTAGFIQIESPITKSAGGDATLTIRGNSRVFVWATGDISSTSNKLNVVLWSDYDDDNDGGVSDQGDITTNGGHVWMGGSSTNGGSLVWNGLTVGDGPSEGSVSANWNALDLYASISTSGGDFLAWAGDGYNAGVDGIASNGGSYTVNTGTGDVTLITDYYLGSGINGTLYRTTGVFTLAPNGGEFPSTFDFDPTGNPIDGYNFGGDFNYLDIREFDGLSGFVIGHYEGMSDNGTPLALGNTTDVTISSKIEINGPIDVYGGDIQIDENLNTMAGGASGDVLIKGSGDIMLAASKTITTSNGDVILWANSDGQTANGGVFLRNGSSITTSGGNVWIGGGSGSTTWNGLTVGDGYAIAGTVFTPYYTTAGQGLDGNGGIYLEASSIDTDGGHILLKGDGSSNLWGIVTHGNNTISSSAGTIELVGIKSATTNDPGILFGFHDGVVGAPAGNTTINSSASGQAISISGSGTGDGNGIAVDGIVAVESTGSGSIELLGTGGSSGYGIEVGNFFNGSNLGVYAASGDITLDGGTRGISVIQPGNTGSSAGDSKLTVGQGGNVASSSSDFYIIGDVFSVATSNGFAANTSGKATIAPYSASFTSALSFPIANVSLGASITGLTLGKVGNTANITVTTAQTIAGPISIYGGDITINENLNTTGGGAAGDVLMKGSGDITIAATKSINTAGADITLWSNSDGETTNGGYITLANSTTIDSRTAADRAANDGTDNDTGGGTITLGGGSTSTTLVSGTVVPTGYALKATNAQVGGIEFGSSANAGIELTSGGGDIVLKGKSTVADISGAESNGVFLYPGITIDAGASGDIMINGQAENGDYNAGFYPSYQLGSGNTIIRSVNGDITLTGESIGGSNIADRGIILMAGNGNTLTIEATGTGKITLIGNSGTGANAFNDFYTQNAIDILAASGNISLEGRGNGRTEITNTVSIGRKPSTNVTSSSSNIAITDNTLFWAGSGALNLITSGTVTIQPYGDDFSTALSTAQTTFSTDVSGLTIGKASCANGTSDVDVTVNAATTIAGPITIYGGTINASADVAITTTGALKFMASKDIVGATGTDLSTQGGDVLLASNTDNSDGGAVLITGVTIESNGGAITLGGGDLTGSGYAEGSSFGAIGQRYRGMWVDQSTIDASGASSNGNIVLRGRGWQVDGSSFTVLQQGNGDYAIGVDITIGSQIKTGGAGTITINGIGGKNNNVNSHGTGINFFDGPQINTVNGSITLSGTAGTGDARNHAGILMDGGAVPAIYSTTGNISLTGIGDISDIGIEFLAGFNLGWDGVNSGTTGDITLTADAMSFASGFNVKTTGTLAVESQGNSFLSDLSWPISNFGVGSTLGGLRLGKSSNTRNITIGSSQLVSGPIDIYGADLALNAALTATNDDINLHASGAVTQSAALTASGLGLHGAGTFTLTNTSNNVSTIAGGDNTTKLGNVSYVDASGGLEIGIVNPTGIYSTGPVLIETLDGNITLAKEITTDDGSEDAIILNAGKSAAIGTATGGNIIVSGTPVLATGAGGITKLFSGREASSTGLTALVGGDTNVRYGVDETTTTFNPVLANDNAYALYRTLGYKYNGTWSPSDPNGVATINDDIEIVSGNAIINTATSCNSMLVYPGAGLTINNAVTLTVANGLTLESNATTYSSLILDGSVAGTMTYKRHVNAFNGTTGNDLISAPLTGQTFDTFATANPNIFENPSNTNQKLFGPFDKTTGAYVFYTNTDTSTLPAAVGYRAGRDASEDATYGTTFSFTGTAENGPVAINIVNSGPQFAVWNLIGNPYPSYLKVQDFLNYEVATGVANIDLFASGSKAIYGYDGNASDGWTIYNLATTTATTVITPGQGFFVSADAANVAPYDLQFTAAMRSTGTTDDFIVGRNTELVYLVLNLGASGKTYHTDFYFNANASEGLDEGYDAAVWGGTIPNFAIYSELVEDNTGKAIALQALNTSNFSEITVPLGVHANQGENITFSISDTTLPESVNVYLEDMELSTVTLLNTADCSLTPGTDLSGTGRFFLRFTTSSLSTPTPSRIDLNIYVLNASKHILISGVLQEVTAVDLYDIQGRKILTTILDSNTTENRIDVSTLSEGVYMVYLKTQEKHVVTKKVILH